MVRAPRSLVRWGEYEERALILSLQLACNETGVTLPWHRVVHHMSNLNVPATEGAIVQHLSKMRQRMEQAGQAVPPPLRRGGGNSIAAPSKSTTKRPMPPSSALTTKNESIKSTSHPRTSLRVHKKKKNSNLKAKKNGLNSTDFDDDSSATVENEDPEADYVPDKKSTNPARTIQTTSKSVQQIKKESSVDEQSDNEEEVAPIKRRRRYGAGSKLLNMEDSDPGSPPTNDQDLQPEKSDKTNTGDLIPFPTYEADVNDNFLTNEDITATMHNGLPDAGETLLGPTIDQYGNPFPTYNPFNYGDIQAPMTDLGFNNSYNGIGQMSQIPTYNQNFGDQFGAFNPFASHGGIPLNGDYSDNMGVARGISSSTEQSVGHHGGYHPNYFNSYGVGADTVLGGGIVSDFEDAYLASTMGGHDA